MESQGGWACPSCKSLNLFEDRYCGECGGPRNPAVAGPIVPPRDTVTGILPDLYEPPAPRLQGLSFVIVAGLAASIAFGAAYYYVASWIFDIKILFPLLLGAAIGGTLRLAALKGRCRKGSVLLAVALAAGAGAYALRQTLVTFHELADVRRHLADTGKPASETGFFHVLGQRAGEGISIGRNRSMISGAGFWIFMLVEAGLAAGVAAASVVAISRLSYCGRCRLFVNSVPVFRVNGRESDALSRAIRHQKWKRAKELAERAAPTPTDRAEAALLKCTGCETSSIRVDLYEGKRFKKVMHVALPSDSLRELARSA